ncbi:hypothetical protein PINS_up006507 [Pythium insidiosum]|nr:hypothetical protein PINS_up006507 [Pythium insidiosum]
MGGFGFGMLAAVQMLGFYQAQHVSSRRATATTTTTAASSSSSSSSSSKPFLAYVLQVTTTHGSTFLVYRRYSQIAALASNLHFHPSVGLPPKYALQVFPLTEEQLRQRFDGLQAFIAEVFATLAQQHEDGLQHDVDSTAGLDMQIFYDFVAHQRNRPPPPVKTLPEWAKPPNVGAILASQSSSMSSLSLHVPAPGASVDPYPVALSRASSFGSVDQIDGREDLRGRTLTWQDVDSMDSELVGLSADPQDSIQDDGAEGNTFPISFETRFCKLRAT